MFKSMTGLREDNMFNKLVLEYFDVRTISLGRIFTSIELFWFANPLVEKCNICLKKVSYLLEERESSG